MPNLTAKLVEVFQLGEKIVGVLDLPRHFWPEPGQYLPCQRLSEKPEIMTTPLFKVIGDPNRLCVAPLPGSWPPGDRLALLPPQGNGFKLPHNARRIGLLAMSIPSSRLLTLVKPALAQNAAVSLFCDPQPDPDLLSRVPSVVEVGPLSALQDNLQWPDFLAVDLPLACLEHLQEILPPLPLPFEGQVLVRTSMPCHGVGECGVCTVKTRRGWRLACVNGPVFPLAEVLHVA
jgi:dihydroorotate dehydrogenase electron transfer subunit